MTENPNLRHELATAEQLDALFHEHNMAEKLASCDSESFYEPQSLMHETFCCKKNTTIYKDASTKVEVAEICRQTFPSSGEIRDTLVKLVIENVVYHLPIP
jgi:hypothetical protein